MPRGGVVGNSAERAVGDNEATRRGNAKYLSVFPFLYFGLSRSFIVHMLTEDIHQLEWELRIIIYQEFIMDSFGLGGLE